MHRSLARPLVVPLSWLLLCGFVESDRALIRDGALVEDCSIAQTGLFDLRGKIVAAFEQTGKPYAPVIDLVSMIRSQRMHLSMPVGGDRYFPVEVAGVVADTYPQDCAGRAGSLDERKAAIDDEEGFMRIHDEGPKKK